MGMENIEPVIGKSKTPHFIINRFQHRWTGRQVTVVAYLTRKHLELAGEYIGDRFNGQKETHKFILGHV